jgi:hypothetical protein
VDKRVVTRVYDARAVAGGDPRGYVDQHSKLACVEWRRVDVHYDPKVRANSPKRARVPVKRIPRKHHFSGADDAD